MDRLVAFDPNTEVIGYTLTSFRDCLTHEEVEPLVHAHGIDSIDPNRWYSQQIWLDVLTDVMDQPNSTENLVASSMKLAKKIIFPASVTTVQAALAGGSTAYQKNHRNGDPGYVTCEDIDERHVRLMISTPYPDDFIYGTRYGYARRFLTDHSTLRVYRSNWVHYRQPEDPPLVLDVQW